MRFIVGFGFLVVHQYLPLRTFQARAATVSNAKPASSAAALASFAAVFADTAPYRRLRNTAPTGAFGI
jgi:hypothetical protein